MESDSGTKRRRFGSGRLLLILGGLAIAGCGNSERSGPSPSDGDPPALGVSCLGRIAPEDGIYHIVVPGSSYPGPSPIAELLVKEGDKVTAGEIVAVLENKERLEAASTLADAQVGVAESRIAQAKAGAANELAAQQAEVERLEAGLQMAKDDYKRRMDIRDTGAVSAADLDHARVDVETDGKLVDTAKDKLKSLVDVRETDATVAEKQYEAAVADAKRAKAEIGQAVLRSPIDGVVIKLHAHAGELPASQGVMELAKTDSMFVIAEVYETDIARVRMGQQASVTSEALPKALTGVVKQIGFKVGTREIVSDDPAVSNSARVVEVKVALNESAPAANLIGARVTVRLMP